jgi:hypothetical protein
MLLHSKRIVVRRPVAFVGRREVVRPWGQTAKIEIHAQVCMKAVHTRGSRAFRLCGAAASVYGDGNGILAAGAEVRKENVRGYDSSWKGYGRDVRGLAPSGRSCLAEINRLGNRRSRNRLRR